MDHRTRSHRPRGYNDPGHAHELTCSCYRRYPLLSKARSCQWLADAIDAARQELNYAVWAYVFMPDHIHLIVWPRERQYDDSDFLGRFKEPVSRQAMQYLKQHAPHWLTRLESKRGRRIEHHFWQPGRGFDRNIVRAATLLAMIDYLHDNPVRKQLVTRARDWKWSSAGWYEECPLNTLRPDPIPWDWLEGAK
jgi:putative transposase